MTRDLIIRELMNRSLSAGNLSQRVGKSVASIENDLEHIRTSLRNDSNIRLLILPGSCTMCNYSFQNKKIKTPKKCPKCHNEKIKAPEFMVEKRNK